MSWTTTFLCFIVVHTAGSSITPTISGVFLAQETLLNYTEAESICTRKYLSSLATLEQVTNAFNHGYESCRWGWVKEHIVIMLRQTPVEDCGRYSLGVLTSECPGLRADSVFCFWSNSTHRGIYTNKSMTSYENATNICTSNGDIIATQMQIEQTTNRSVTFNSTGWYDWGNGFFDINGTFVASRCEAVGNSSSAYCFNSQLPDVLPQTNNTGWKRILIICLLGSIFVVLLLAAIFMKGNQFICFLRSQPSVRPDVQESIYSQIPRWNVTGAETYEHRKPSINPTYARTFSFVLEKRPPAIRPDMSKYKSHFYSNTGYDNTGEK